MPGATSIIKEADRALLRRKLRENAKIGQPAALHSLRLWSPVIHVQINDVQPSKTIGVVIPVGPSNNSFEIFVEEYRQSIAACSAAIETAIIFNNIPPSRVSQLRSLIPSNFREKDLGT